MSAFLSMVAKALVGAIPALSGAAFRKIILPIYNKIIDAIAHRKRVKENKEKAKRLQDAKDKKDIDGGFGDMP